MEKSALQIARAAYQPKLPKGLRGNVSIKEGAPTQSVGDQEEIKHLFPNTYGMPLVEFVPSDEKKTYEPTNIGVILSGGQAPGGHNVICGLYDELKKQNPASKLYGFLMGPGGLVDHKYIEITEDIINEYRNTGGFDMIGSGRTKLEEESQFEAGLTILKELDIKAVVIIGGDDSNTNACVLAEYYAAHNAGVRVIGCPKTIDGDLKNDQIETSFGFDTACKTYAEVIGNIQRDANSARKYWHFIKLMGRSASHIALECALQCQPNICIVSEEVEEKNQTLDDIVTYIAGVVARRAADGNNFGTVLIPEGLIEFIPAMKRLIAELNDLLATPEAAEPSGEVLQNDADPAPLSTAPPNLENGGEILARRYSQGSGAGYVTLAAGSIKNSTQHTDAELAAAADGPLPFDIELDSADPQVLILHTHATETYQPWDELVFDPDFSARTTDTAANMVAVGARMARVLNEAGINTVQDTTLHDSPSYTESYARSAQTARSWVAKYPSIKVILDVHRDAIESDGARIKPLCQIDGQDTAQVMIIAGCDNGATVCLPNWQENLKFAAAWESAMESAYPGLTRPVLCGYRFYNQDVTTGSLLIEVGGHANTLAEALRGGEYAARALAALFGGQS